MRDDTRRLHFIHIDRDQVFKLSNERQRCGSYQGIKEFNEPNSEIGTTKKESVGNKRKGFRFRLLLNERYDLSAVK